MAGGQINSARRPLSFWTFHFHRFHYRAATAIPTYGAKLNDVRGSPRHQPMAVDLRVTDPVRERQE